MSLLRIVLYGIVGFLIGFELGDCSKALGQSKQNDKIELNSNNTVLLRGPIDTASAQNVQLDIAKLVGLRLFRRYPIYLVLDSPGGDVEAGVQMIEFAKTIPNLETITIFSASMAADAVESLPGKRLITNNGSMMFHRAKGAFQGQFEVGEVESRLDYAKKIILALEQVNSTRMGMNLIEYKAKIKDELWLTSSEAIKSHAADKVVDILCSKELIDKRNTSTFETLFGTYKVVFSGCPTFRVPLIVESIRENVVSLDLSPFDNKVVKFDKVIPIK